MSTKSFAGFFAGVVLLVSVEALAGSTPVRLTPAQRSGGACSLSPPKAGSWDLKAISPSVLELSVITSKGVKGRPTTWDWVSDRVGTSLPRTQDFDVRVRGKRIRVKAVGFKRRVVYAPLGESRLRIGNWLYLKLSEPIPDNGKVHLSNPRGNVWVGIGEIEAKADQSRYSPAIHVDQLGYAPDLPKKGLVGYYLGSLGELDVNAGKGFSLVEEDTGRKVFSGPLTRRPENGFSDMVPPYRKVYMADFTAFKQEGVYRIEVPGLGRSFPFHIHPGVPAALTRTYALGIFHQRCGAALGLPYTRFQHKACHTAPALVPFGPGSTRHEQALDNLYPRNRTGYIDVSGGHHDAGDYSKYLTNSARLVHALVLAADAFPGAGELDNLGLPESGDGKSDLLQIAMWEADFIARMQDDDGGFYFLVYPRRRAYEDDVPPDQGDRQVVFPKQTAATAAAVAALAQASSSPLFRREHPKAAVRYTKAAVKGWQFLKRAWKKYGRKGAYRKITHYGDIFEDRDEVTWAAMELFLATGKNEYLRELKGFDPTSSKTWRWQWVRMFEGYGAAIRSCALADATGRKNGKRLGSRLRRLCRKELLGAAHELARFSRASAYRTSFPLENKRHRTAGWYFSAENLFDLAAASVLDDRAEFTEAMVGNIDYHLGANPLNLSYLTGVGFRRPLDIVSQWARNDKRELPPSGIPLGDVVTGYGWITGYDHERGRWSFPPDEDRKDPYPIYDRFTDSWNTQAEVVTAVQARCLAGAAFLMGRTTFKDQPWKPPWGRITGVPGRVGQGDRITARLEVNGLDVNDAQVVWDKGDADIGTGPVYNFKASGSGVKDLEVEAMWPDGRRVFAAQRFMVGKSQ
ncbi:MAG: glycoside hydrolase family 9 [Deltaproteobacteria bacterium]|nr:glycoside hydrolase family 9 [Deltaproteobacteria bacterium]